MRVRVPYQRRIWLLAGMALLLPNLVSCRTIPAEKSKRESDAEAKEALSAVAGALSGKKLSDAELRDLEHQIRTDKEAQSAVQAITGSVGGRPQVVKYCPITGKRYAANIETCPEHQIKLEVVGE